MFIALKTKVFLYLYRTTLISRQKPTKHTITKTRSDKLPNNYAINNPSLFHIQWEIYHFVCLFSFFPLPTFLYILDHTFKSHLFLGSTFHNVLRDPDEGIVMWYLIIKCSSWLIRFACVRADIYWKNASYFRRSGFPVFLFRWSQS